MKAAAEEPAPVRPGVELMSCSEADAIQPPLSDDEWLHWLSGPSLAFEAAQQRQKAGLPELPEDAKIRHLRGEHLAYPEAQQKD